MGAFSDNPTPYYDEITGTVVRVEFYPGRADGLLEFDIAGTKVIHKSCHLLPNERESEIKIDDRVVSREQLVSWLLTWQLKNPCVTLYAERDRYGAAVKAIFGTKES